MILVVGGVGLFVSYASGKAREAKAKRDHQLAEIARLLGGTSDGSSATGTLHGVATTIDYVTRGSGSSAESWTEVLCALPRGYPLSLHVHHHGWFDDGKIERGEMVDLVLGDPVFDDRYLVEGAPAEVVRRLIDRDVRAYLLGTNSATLETHDDGRLRLSVRGWLEEPHQARPALDCCARVAAAVRAATAAADDAVAPEQTDSPYRPMLDDAPVREARAAREAEVARLDSLRQARAERQKYLFGAIAIGFVVVWLLAVLGD
jgi:hypothetical protein